MPAVLVYVTPTQLSAVVPYAVSGTATQLVIESDGLQSAPVTLPLVPARPALSQPIRRARDSRRR
jgi:uncharacterized protein (TIGR03437 family)